MYNRDGCLGLPVCTPSGLLPARSTSSSVGSRPEIEISPVNPKPWNALPLPPWFRFAIWSLMAIASGAFSSRCMLFSLQKRTPFLPSTWFVYAASSNSDLPGDRTFTKTSSLVLTPNPAGASCMFLVMFTQRRLVSTLLRDCKAGHSVWICRDKKSREEAQGKEPGPGGTQMNQFNRKLNYWRLIEVPKEPITLPLL